jgi:hypothetical protein
MHGIEKKSNYDSSEKNQNKKVDSLYLNAGSEILTDPEVKKVCNKIISKWLENSSIDKIFLNQKSLENQNLSAYLDDIVVKYPQLWSFLYVDFWMGDFKNKRYSQLNSEEKVKFLALEKTLHGSLNKLFAPYKEKNGRIDEIAFRRAYAEQVKGIINTLAIDFKLNQLSNLLDIKKTLKQDYMLSDIEAQKFILYLEEIKKNPKNLTEAWSGTWYLIMLFAGILLWALWMKLYYDIITPDPETIIKTGRVTIWDPRTIAKLMTVEADFSTTGTMRKEQFKVDPNDNWLKNKSKELLNVAQTREIVMELNGKFWVVFDLDNSRFEYDYDTKKIYAYLKNPELTILQSHPKVLSRNSEVFEINAFNNAELELLDSMKNDVLMEASNRDLIYLKAKDNAAKILEAIYWQAFEITQTPFYWVEVIIDQNPVIHLDSEWNLSR